jgi:sugar/nucleoside kinase (ribokinase family)
MQDVSLDTSGIVRDPSVSTSTTAVLVSPDGERSFLHYSGGNAAMSEGDVDFEIIRGARILHVAAAFLVPGLDGEPMARVLARAREMGVTTCLDTAWDADGRWMSLVEPCLSHVDLFVPSIDEAQVLSGREEPRAIAEFFQQCGVEAIVIKLGANGCYARICDREYTIPAFEVETVVDTLGAGDAFVAGFLAGTVKGWEIERACRLANAVGACCVSGRGASGVKSLEETIQQYAV